MEILRVGLLPEELVSLVCRVQNWEAMLDFLLVADRLYSNYS